MAKENGTEQKELEEDVPMGPMDVCKLEGNGITSSDTKKLRESGYHTVESVAYAPKKEIICVRGISEPKA
ncbi:hypothetical protein A3Q56_04116, partial [Intoshia linei]